MRRNILKMWLAGVLMLAATANFAVSDSRKEKATVGEDMKTASFMVYGNCGMCEKRIEGALKEVEGIKKADWNKDSKMIEVTFDEHLISLVEIKTKIANAGYDTDEIKASEESYNALPGCCQYERPENK